MKRSVIEIFGHDFIVPEGDVECHRVIRDQVHDVDKALAFCKKRRLCVQAGGNMGIWPFYLADKFESVITFEPHPENFFCLVNNVPQQNVIKVQAGLSAERDTMGIEGDPRNAGAYQMAGEGHIPTLALDNVIYGDRLDFLCLDIEGMELLALKGAARIIEESAPVIMLEDKGLSSKYGTQKGDVTAWLDEKGYTLRTEIHRDLIFTKRPV